MASRRKTLPLVGAAAAAAALLGSSTALGSSNGSGNGSVNGSNTPLDHRLVGRVGPVRTGR